MFNILRIDNIKIYEDLDEEKLKENVCKQYRINIKDVIEFSIYKKSIDARDKNNIYYNYSVNILTNHDNNYKKYIVNEKKIDEFKVDKEKISINKNPIIIGAGPAGLFCALELIKYGIKPIIIEQGSKVEERISVVEEYRKTGIVNTKCNVQFGEGGAGTFSDGKLTTGINDERCKDVLKTFVSFGAPQQIMYINKPHIGTDNLVNIIKNMRNYIIKKGGIFYFNTKAVDFNIQNGKIVSIVLDSGDILDTDIVVLAIGHSARDTFKTLKEKNVYLERKNFSVGVRIEQLQEKINNMQYGTKHKLNLPPAEYKLVYHGLNNRSCYSFCMCPGGEVMPSASEKESIVTNGMSRFKRDLENANSALLVNVTTEDFSYSEDVLEGMYFQEELEKKAYTIAGKNGNAPAQLAIDFINNVKSNNIGKVKPTYKPGVTLCNLRDIFPDFVNDTLKEALIYWRDRLNGFIDDDAILTGVETRSSSPIKITRNDKYISLNIDGIYPCGEGAGYAGGIMSASVDGIKIARAIISNNS